MEWQQKIKSAVARYSEPLVRSVARKLLKPRTVIAVGELRERLATASSNEVLVDRRLKELSEPARSILALVSLSRQPLWRLGGLLETLGFLQAGDGLETIFELFQWGFLYPDRKPDAPLLETFEAWLASGKENAYRVWVPPAMSSRALATGLPTMANLTDVVALADQNMQEADGLEILLRLSYLWQQLRVAPLRLTAQGDYYKRDLERLQDSILTSPLESSSPSLPDLGQALVAIGLALGIFLRDEGEIRTGEWPVSWQTATLTEVLADLWSVQPNFSAWTPGEGWRGFLASPSPFASGGVLALSALSRLAKQEWVPPRAIGEWLVVHHPFWKDFDHPPDLTTWADNFLCGQAVALGLVQVAQAAKGMKFVRLSSRGRAVLGLEEEKKGASFARTLLVQPNMEVLVYRQGLTPSLLMELNHLGHWKTLGAACTLQLEPESVYHALEAGSSYERIVQMLQQHGVRELPTNVIQAFKTWADKRERITIYATAQLLEFPTSEDTEAALQRGLPAVRISDTCLLVPNEEDVDFRNFRLIATRDYSLPPGVCIELADDGVTLTVDETRADLLLLSELEKYAEPVIKNSTNGPRQYRLTPARLQALRVSPSSIKQLEEWYQQRTGQSLSAAARFLIGSPDGKAMRIQRTVVVEVPVSLVADGLEQWPETRVFLQARLGPTAFAVAEEHVPALQAKLAQLGYRLEE